MEVHENIRVHVALSYRDVSDRVWLGLCTLADNMCQVKDRSIISKYTV